LTDLAFIKYQYQFIERRNRETYREIDRKKIGQRDREREGEREGERECVFFESNKNDSIKSS